MTAVFQPDDGSIRSRLAQYAAADAYRQQAVSTQEAAALASFYSAYPNADPGLIAGLVKAGKQPNDPTVQKIMLQHTQQQQHSGFFDKIGDVIGGAVSKVGQGLGFVAGSSASGLAALGKGVVRSSLVALETPLQETQDFSRALLYEGLSPFSGGNNLASMNRNFGAALQQSGSSSGVEALSKIVGGDFGGIDLGTGFIPGGKVEQTVKEKAGRLQLQFGGNTFGGPGNPAITLGRLVGATVTEPGTQPYNILSGLIDAAAAWYGDPAAALGAAAKEAEVGGRISRALPVALDEGLAAGARELAIKPSLVPSVGKATSQGAAVTSTLHTLLGMIPGHRPTTLPDITETALSKGGSRIVDHLAGENDPLTIYNAMGRKPPIQVANELAQAATPQEVLQVLNNHVGSGITQFPEWNGFKVQAMGAPSIRLAGMMPGKIMDPNNLEDVFTQTDRLLGTMKTSPELRNDILRSVMSTPDAQSVAPVFFDGLAKAADEMAPKLRVKLEQLPGESDTEFASRLAGQQKVKAAGLVRSFAADGDKMRAYLGDEITANDKAAGLAVDGKLIPAQAPYQMLEFLNSAIPVPNARDIRTATATLGRLVDNPFFKGTQGYADTLMHFWKPLTIIKPALTLRLVGEHQAEMAASGLDSLFSHPLSFVAALVNNPEQAQEFMDSTGPIGKLAHPFQTAEALASKATGPLIGKVRQGDLTGVPFNADGESALKGLLSSMGNDAQDLAGVAGAHTVRGQKLFTMMDGPTAYSRAWHGSLSQIYNDPVWQKVAEGRGNLDDVKRWFWAEGQGYRNDLARRMPMLNTPAGADAYIDSLYRGAMYRTGGDPATLDAVSTGMFNGQPWGQLDDQGKWSLSDAMKRHLENVQGPDSVKGPITLAGDHPHKSYFDDTMTYLFDHLLQKPFEQLVGSPAVRQNYWQRVEQMVPYMDGPTRAATLEAAAKEGIGPGSKTVAAMRDAQTVANPTITSFEDAHGLALKHALNETKKVLYDQTNKSQFFDAMRTVFPFGEAWRQALTRWGRIAWNNPNTIVGGQKIYTGATGSGFFHKDDQGNEVFNMPFGRNISKLALGLTTPLFGGNSQGAGVDLTSRVSGLSMIMADALPGVGPVVQASAGAILPNTPDWDWARNFISPRGPNDYSQGLLESSLPGPVKSLAQAFFQKGNPRQYASYVSDASNYLVSTGKYDMTDPTGQQQSKMLNDAQAIAKGMYVLKGLGQAFAPSSPSLESLAKVKDGRTLEQAQIANEFHAWEQDPKIGYDGAVQMLLDRYGSQAFLSTQGKTLSLVGQAPLGTASSDWARTHQDIVKTYPLAWGLFAPQDAPGSFDYSAYQRQLQNGQRVDVTPAQRVALAQIHLAAHQYAIAQTKLSAKPSASERAWLGQIKQILTEEYPAYGKDVPGLPAKYPPDQVIAQLSRAVVDPRLSNSPVAKAASLYLQAREQGIVAAQALTSTGKAALTKGAASGRVLTGSGAEPIQAWLSNIGNLLVEKYPEFAPFFNAVFARELT